MPAVLLEKKFRAPQLVGRTYSQFVQLIDEEFQVAAVGLAGASGYKKRFFSGRATSGVTTAVIPGPVRMVGVLLGLDGAAAASGILGGFKRI